MKPLTCTTALLAALLLACGAYANPAYSGLGQPTSRKLLDGMAMGTHPKVAPPMEVAPPECSSEALANAMAACKGSASCISSAHANAQAKCAVAPPVVKVPVVTKPHKKIFFKPHMKPVKVAPPPPAVNCLAKAQADALAACGSHALFHTIPAAMCQAIAEAQAKAKCGTTTSSMPKMPVKTMASAANCFASAKASALAVGAPAAVADATASATCKTSG